MKLIIQIPCLNEEETLPVTLAALPKHIDGVDQIKILVIDDGSTDKTFDVAHAHGVHHIVRLKKRRGLASAFATGLDAALKAGADIIVNTDADNQYKGEDIPRLVRPILERKADIVIGNRDIENIRQFSWVKKRLQRLGSWVIRNITGSTIQDATTGFRAYSREAALKLNIISEYTYTLETIIQAQHKDLAIANITISTNDVHRPSRLFKNIPEYIKRSIITIVRIYAMYNPFRLFMRLGGLMSLIGFFIGCRFVYFYMIGLGGGKIQSLILASIFMIVGFQLMIVGLVSDLIAANRQLLENTLYRLRSTDVNKQ